ncbi:endonuclease/exonuclease/phosphatase family protein [Elioraea sp.]|uniref:endonuclease/exonuclease/phosphatase family protein n=1 Tax=Elioraea sp. TaxID=2185103 RepID=UPI0025BF3C9C|nr:endonuclease/exonuclease/phosphatase family protein [Elioraea sp.]
MANADTFVEKDNTKYVLTWNSFGDKLTTLRSWLDVTNGIATKVNVVCCQEFGNSPLLYPATENHDHSYKYLPFTNRTGGMHIFWTRWARTHHPGNAPDNLRCSLAVIRVGAANLTTDCYIALENAARPAIGINYADAYIYSFHNDAHGGAATPGKDMADFLNTTLHKGEQWMLVGDFNCTPDKMIRSDWTVRYDKSVSTTRRVTGTGQEIANNHYDYVVQANRSGVEERRFSNHIGKRMPANILSSDHFPVLFQIFSTKEQ